ncbi:MAG: methyltransferase domain-containing protein [Oscillospiraceae bacterium]|nr:methyltransferase domain-containing protein [Oscillospiraceae bacterium]
MIKILCPNCGEPLTREPSRWFCVNGHSFDVARQGYVNLLPVGWKHSKNPGDSRLQVAARKEFLDGGHYLPVAETLAALLAAESPKTLLDVGCGEGYYLTFVQQVLPGLEGIGVDISKDAVRYAAVRNKNAVFLTATASHLPFPACEFDALTSLFALTLPEEFARVVRPGGIFVQVTAGPDHLMGLKSIIYPEIHRKEPHEAEDLPGFTLQNERLLEFPFTLEGNEDVLRLLSMTPHVMRITAEGMARARAAERLSDRAQVCFRVYRRAGI